MFAESETTLILDGMPTLALYPSSISFISANHLSSKIAFIKEQQQTVRLKLGCCDARSILDLQG